MHLFFGDVRLQIKLYVNCDRLSHGNRPSTQMVIPHITIGAVNRHQVLYLRYAQPWVMNQYLQNCCCSYHM